MQLISSKTEISIELTKSEFNVIQNALRYMKLESSKNSVFTDKAKESYRDICNKLDDISDAI